MKRQRLVRLPWEEFSRKFVAKQDLPLGAELRLYSNDRRKRADWHVKCRRFKSLVKVLDGDRVSSLLDVATNQLSTDIVAQGLKLRLLGPQGQVVNGNTLVRTVRAMPRARTDYDDDEAERKVWETAEVRRVADMQIKEAEYLREDPSEVVLPAYLSALVAWYGMPAVVAALEDRGHGVG